MKLTYFNTDQNAYEVQIYENTPFIYREEGERYLNNGVIISPKRHFVSGFIVDRLAEYENTGLTPYEIRELKYVELKNLKESNRLLRQSNDEYYVAYQKLLDENYKLKSLLKDLLESTT